jgi:glycosyltransferase involved in cell wall biosynthesis
MAPSSYVIVTAHNEADRIGATLAAVGSVFPGAPVFLADDGSTDATPETGLLAGARLVRSERVIGKGAAATAAARNAMRQARADADADAEAEAGGGDGGGGDGGEERAGAVFILCDADLGDSARELAALAEVIRRGDGEMAVAVFSRRTGGGFGLALAFARWAIRRRCGFLTSAPISGQRALGPGVLEDVLPFAGGFGMEVGMTIDAVRAGHRVVEVELDLSHRATRRTPAGFVHRARQLVDFVRAYRARG